MEKKIEKTSETNSRFLSKFQSIYKILARLDKNKKQHNLLTSGKERGAITADFSDIKR